LFYLRLILVFGRPESKLVSEIVQFILKKLNHTSLGDSKGLVGIDSRIERLKTLLCIRSSEARIIGIWGMGGIGKTTIAEAVFNSISSQYESCCFITNVREKLEECGGLILLREEFLSRVLEQENLRIDTPRMGSTLIKERIRHKKVLTVLDDVNDVEQVECLIERHDMFGPASRILVTSRDRQVLKNVADEIYEVEELNCSEARQLFSLSVFKGNHIPKYYMGLSIRAVNYAKGNPLALKVLGSFLFDLRKEDWENALNKLERNPQLKIYNMLKVSFDALGDEEKNIFLDIAGFFKGKQIDYVKRILDGCGFSINIGVFFLAERCLITSSNGKIEMHDLLQEMAFKIVRQESIKERDVNQVLTKNLVSVMYVNA